jgi:riboflavin synthase
VFSGIVEAMGLVAAIEDGPAGGRVLRVDAGDWPRTPRPGASVAVSGCCLTVTEEPSGRPAPKGRLRFDVIPQTLAVTTLGALRPGDPVNLEAAVTPATMLDGHLVQGHVDGIARVIERPRVADPAERRLRVEPPPDLMEFVVDKGSVALDGVSLTVAAVGPSWLEVALIPTTLAITTLGRAAPGTLLNLETDYIAKIVVAWLKRREERPEKRPGLFS